MERKTISRDPLYKKNFVLDSELDAFRFRMNC